MPAIQTGIALGAKMRVERQSQDDSKSNGLTHEEARRRLDEVRGRYGIHLADPRAHSIADNPSSSQKASAKLELGLAPSVPETRPKPVDWKQSGSAVKRREGHPARELPSDSQSFHYLIRIAECTSVLHCEIKADHPRAARDQLQRIPNLVEWREISFWELVETTNNAQ
jgi:hypothetical protein